MTGADNIRRNIFQPPSSFNFQGKDSNNSGDSSLLFDSRAARIKALGKSGWKDDIKIIENEDGQGLISGSKSGDSNSVQKVLDKFGNRLEDAIKKSPPGKLKTEWLDKTAKGRWYVKLGDFILKLPLRVAMNLLNLIYSIIKGALYSFVHPVKALQKFGNHVVDVANKLMQPLTWTKIGAGIIGASVSASLVTGNPIAVIGLGIGASLVLGGLISGVIKEAVKNEKGGRKEAVKKEFIEHLKGIPMALLTGFAVGALVGGVMLATMSMQGMGAAATESSKITASLTATPPSPTLALPPFLATHLHHEHPGSEKNYEKDEGNEEKKEI